MQNDESNEGEEDADGHEEQDTFELPPRVIRPAHFNSAFEQVTATCLRDMESVQQLRSWAAKFSIGAESANTIAATNGSIRTSTPVVNSSHQPYQGMSNLDNSVSAYSNACPTRSIPVGANVSYRSYRGMPNLDTSNALSTYSNVNPIGSTPPGTNVPYQSHRGISKLDNSSYVNPTGSTPGRTNVSYQPYRGMSNLDDSLSTYSSINPTGLNTAGTNASHRGTVDESV